MLLLCALTLAGGMGVVRGSQLLSFSTITGYFSQDISQGTQPPPRFGLLLGDWKELDSNVDALENEGGTGSIKVLYLVRHGEGIHNVAEAEYGKEVWDSRVSLDPKYTDAPLTQKGVEQAKALHDAVMKEVSSGMPVELIVSSPLERALNTTNIAFESIKVRRVVAEGCRELISRHTCDHRSNVSTLKPRYQEFGFDGLDEEDRLWGRIDESETEVKQRAQAFLEQLWELAGPSVRHIGVGSHSGFIQALLAQIGHVGYRPMNAEMIPVVLRAQVGEEKAGSKNLHIYVALAIVIGGFGVGVLGFLVWRKMGRRKRQEQTQSNMWLPVEDEGEDENM
eukprot:comp6828_c0_seq2/m.2576 comp6828_c0_seq2/g.2576  ORF comp6828_c0_seq2/g.2576 comp6828_c0_seq2/m.2576 type:complete len:337 (-) comp6828_c0_seq2:431-1441(-)